MSTLTHLERVTAAVVGWQAACAKTCRTQLVFAYPPFESTDRNPLPETFYGAILYGERALDLVLHLESLAP